MGKRGRKGGMSALHSLSCEWVGMHKGEKTGFLLLLRGDAARWQHWFTHTKRLVKLVYVSFSLAYSLVVAFSSPRRPLCLGIKSSAYISQSEGMKRFEAAKDAMKHSRNRREKDTPVHMHTQLLSPVQCVMCFLRKKKSTCHHRPFHLSFSLVQILAAQRDSAIPTNFHSS